MDPDAGWNADDLEFRPLDGDPPHGFDCGRPEQNDFLYDLAWRDQRLWFSVTRLAFIKGILAGFVTTTADLVELGTREKDRGVRYRSLPAAKIAQLAVDRRFAGAGLGRVLVMHALVAIRRAGQEIGMRYVTVDAKPDLESWYSRYGFQRNKVAQKRREEARPGVPNLPVSLRFDLLDARTDGI